MSTYLPLCLPRLQPRYLYLGLGYTPQRKEEAEGLIFMSTYLYVYLGYNLDIYI